MELRCAFVLVLVSLVAAHGYGVKGGGAVAKAEASAAATSGVEQAPISIPAAGGYSSSFSKSSSSSFASSSASSSSSSFSYSSSGAGGYAGTNGIASGKGDCVSGTCQDQSNSKFNELNGSDAALNGLKAFSGSSAGANAFSASSGNSQNAGIPCLGNECSNQGLTGAKSSSGSLAYAHSGDQIPCTGENCSNQETTLTGEKTNSFAAYSQNDGKSPCTGENCSGKSSNSNNCASGSCGPHFQTGPMSYGFEPKDKLLSKNEESKTVFNSNDKNLKYDDFSVTTSNSKPLNIQGSKDIFKQGEVTETSHGSSALNSYNTLSPKCITGNCNLDSAKIQYPSSAGAALVPIPSTYLTTPKETSNPELPCTAPGCQAPEINDYPGPQNRPSSYNVPLYTVETTKPASSPQEKDATCISANCKNSYPYTDYTLNPSNTVTPGLQRAPSKTNTVIPTGAECTTTGCGSSTTDIEVPKSSSSSTCLTGNCASNPLPNGNNNVDKHKEPKLPSYLASLPSQHDKLKPFPTLGGFSNCNTGNCASYPSSFSNVGIGAGNSGFTQSSQTTTAYSPIGNINPINCAGSSCAPYPSYQNHEPLPSNKPSYFFTTPSFPNSPLPSQPPKYPNIPNTVNREPVVGSKNPSYIHGASQPSYQNQFPVSSPFQTATSSLPSHISSSPQIVSESNQKNSVYTGGFGGHSGILAPNDYTIPAKPLSPQQRPPVKPIHPYDGSLVPTSSTVNIPTSTSPKVTCTSGNCGTQPSLSTLHFGHIASGSVATTTANSETESKVSNSPSLGQPPKYSDTPYPIYQVPVVGSKYPSFTHGSLQPSYQSQLPVSGPLQTGTISLPSHISSSSQGIGGSNQKGSVYTGGFGGPSGLLAPNDYNIPANPLSPQQRPPVKPSYPYDGSLAPASSTANIPVITSHKVTCASGNCGTQPSLPTTNNGQITSTSVASATANSESKGVLYTGGFGGPPGILVPIDGYKGNFGHSGAIANPVPPSIHNSGLPKGNTHSSYSGFPNAANPKPNTDASAVSNLFNSGYKTQENIGNSLLASGGNSGLSHSSPSSYGSHFGSSNAYGASTPSQPNHFSSSQPNSLSSNSASGSGSQTLTGLQAGVAATANAAAFSGSKTQESGNINKIPSACGNGDCSSQSSTSHYGGSNSGIGLLNSENSPNVGAGAIASAQSGAFSGFFGDEFNPKNNDQLKGGCSGGCASNGANADGGNGSYGTAAFAKSSAAATSGTETDKFGSSRSFATAHASSGAAVKGSYGRR